MILFWGMGPKGVFLLGSAQCSKKISDGPFNVVFSTKKRNYEGTYEQIS